MRTTKLFLTVTVCAAVMMAACSKNNSGDEPKTYTITVVNGDKGTASADKTVAKEGETVTIDVTSNNGYSFKEWIVEGATSILPQATSAKAAFTMPARNVIVSAEFTANEYSITVTARGNGSGKADKTIATMGETVTLDATADNGHQFKKWIVESGGVTCVPGEPAGTATFTMPADNVKIKADFTKGVPINGVWWASSNVNTPGTFAANPEDYGLYYQWNRKGGWSTSDPRTNTEGDVKWYDHSNHDGIDEWQAANNPCPEGWRVPTNEECVALCDETKTTGEWETSNGIYGYMITDEASRNSVFFPCAGRRDDSSKLESQGDYGFYWQSTTYELNAYVLVFYGTIVYTSELAGKWYGFSVRCVDE